MEIKQKAVFILMLCASTFSVSCMAKDYGMCFTIAALRFDLDRDLLRALAKVESNFKPKAIGKKNKNGSTDFGMMQKNDRYLTPLFKAGFKKDDLFDPCTSIYIGAYDLHKCTEYFGKNWRAVGCYNAGFRKNRETARYEYVKKVRPVYEHFKRTTT